MFFTKTRFAPTPSGYLHLGNILSVGITAALAKKNGAKIMLRIDDLDKARANPLYVQDVFDTLDFLGVNWEEGPVNAVDYENNCSQTNRLNLYNQALDRLKSGGELFACICSRAGYAEDGCGCLQKLLPLDTPAANWRIKTDGQLLAVKQTDGSFVEAKLPEPMHNFVVRKKDGHPSYQLASVVDDLHFGVDLIVRGQDLWDSTLAQLFLAQQLNELEFADIAFYHHMLIKAPSGEKLSKSAGDTSVKYFRENGKNAAVIFNFLLDNIGINAKASDWAEFMDIIDGHYFCRR